MMTACGIDAPANRAHCSDALAPSSHEAEPTQRGFAAGQRVFGRYTLEKILGRGGMGIVWRARDDTLQEAVALKFLPDAVRWDPGAFDDLKAETRRARQLTHPNIVRIHDFVEDAGAAAISMELVEGRTLTELRLERPNKIFEPAEILSWLPQLGAALDYAHTQARVVHRDLKPSNLMLTRDGVLKIADFGVARSMADSISRVSMMSAGTLVYMSPQQAMGEEPAATDDIYAVGATLYELLAGKPPFHTGDVRVQLFQRKPDSIAVRRRALGGAGGAVEISDGWEETVAACLAKETDQRPASVGEIAARLAAPMGRTARSGWSRVFRARPGRRWLVAMALVAGAVCGVWLTWSRRTPAPAAAAFTSDETRALAAWNFDGDARDGSGHGFDGTDAVSVPTADRFGRIDRALGFNGQMAVLVPDAPELHWGGSQPFTAAIWLRHDESDALTGEVWRSAGGEVGSFFWAVGLAGGRVHANVGRLHSDFGEKVDLRGPARIPAGEWHHLALASDGEKVRLYLDGAEVAAGAVGVLVGAKAPKRVELRFGQPERLSAWGLKGALDDARLWRRALQPREILALADRAMPPRFVPSNGTYVDTGDLPAAVAAEFGPGAELADWNALKRWHADDIRAWVDEVGFTVGGASGWVQRGGERRFDEKRHYLLNRFDGVKPDYYRAHDELGGMTLALGSWYGSAMRALVAVPGRPPRTESLAPAVDGMIRHATRLGPMVSAIALHWRARIAPANGRVNPVGVRLRSDGGRELRAFCQVMNGDRFGVVLGDGSSAERSRQVAATFGECDFALVVRDGRMRFRATTAVGGSLVFQETAEVTGLRLDAVPELEISGPAESGLANARMIVE